MSPAFVSLAWGDNLGTALCPRECRSSSSVHPRGVFLTPEHFPSQPSAAAPQPELLGVTGKNSVWVCQRFVPPASLGSWGGAALTWAARPTDPLKLPEPGYSTSGQETPHTVPSRVHMSDSRTTPDPRGQALCLDKIPGHQCAHDSQMGPGTRPVSYTHLTLPTRRDSCRSRWSPYH